MTLLLFLLQLTWVDIANEPRQMWTVQDNRVLMHDYANPDGIIQLLNLDTKSVIKKIPVGRGPGEIMQGSKSVSTFSNGDILIWDNSMKRGLFYNSNLDYLGQLIIPTYVGAISDLSLVSDRRIGVFGVDGNFVNVFELSEKREILGPQPKLRIPLQGTFSEYRNSAIRQRFFFRNDSGNLYVSFEYSTDILVIRGDDTWTLSTMPSRIPPPTFDPNDPHSLPYAHIHPKCSVSLAIGNDKIYNLVRGETMSLGRQMLYFNNLAGLDEELLTGHRIDIYDIRTNKFIRTVKLKKGYKTLVYTNNTLYGIRLEGDLNQLEVIVL